MGDVMREMVGDPYAGLYDVDPYPAQLAGYEVLLADLKAAKERGDGDSGCPWVTVDQAISEVEASIASLRSKIEAGILTAVQDKAKELEGYW